MIFDLSQVHRIMDISVHDEDGNVMEDSMTVKTIDDLKKAINTGEEKREGKEGTERDIADMIKKAHSNSGGVWSLSIEKVRRGGRDKR